MEWIKINKNEHLLHWHHWYAWKPVVVGEDTHGNQQLAWLCDVLRKGTLRTVAIVETDGIPHPVMDWEFTYKRN